MNEVPLPLPDSDSDSLGAPGAPVSGAPDIGPELLHEIQRRNQVLESGAEGALTRVGGTLEIYCSLDTGEKRVTAAASVATAFRGYEALLLKRGLREAGLVSSTAAGICGGVHATASSLCLEMALGIKPPPLGIVARNLLLCSQYLDENPMHLFVFSGPDYSRETIRRTNPALWARAEKSPAAHRATHGYAYVGDLMADLERPSGKLFIEALTMVRRAREAYAIIGGKYPHSESIIPGGVALKLTEDQLDRFFAHLRPFGDYAKRCIAIWNEIFDFLYEADPAYVHVGEAPATMIDFGQWDNEEAYDATYENCDDWGRRRWSTPGAIVNGVLQTTRLTELNAGLEEYVERSYYEARGEPRFHTDPLGNALSANHPWNRGVIVNPEKNSTEAPYSWATAMTWRRNNFEVGAYARIYLSALGGRVPVSEHFSSSGSSLLLRLPPDALPAMQAEWRPPAVWNAFERNRARAYAVAFNLLVLTENYQRARRLLASGVTELSRPFDIPEQGEHLGIGFCGAGRGFLAHWAVVRDGAFANYRIAMPSRINAGPRAPWGEPGAIEKAVLNTPVLETGSSGIDVMRAVQSFDPCMPCKLILHGKDGQWSECTVTTSGP